MAFSPDSSQFALVLRGGSEIKVWDTTTGQCLHTRILDNGIKATWIVFPSKNNTPIAVGVRNEQQTELEKDQKMIVQFWETASNRLDTLSSLDSTESIKATVFSPDGIWLAAANNSHIDIWDWARGDRILRFPHGREPPHSMAYARSSANLLASAHDFEVCIWNPESGEALRSVRSTANDLVAFLFDEDRLVVANNAILRTWDSHTGRHLQTLDVLSHDNYNSPAALSADGSRFVAAPDENIRIWDVATKRRLRTLEGYYGRVYSLSLSHDGVRLASIGDSGLKIWDSALYQSTGKGISRAARDHNGDIFAIAVAARGARMVSASRDAVKVWNTADGRCLLHLNPVSVTESDGDWGDWGNGGARNVALSPDGTRLALMPVHGDSLQIWDLRTRKMYESIPWTALTAPSFSPDGSRIAFLTTSYGSTSIKVWKLAYDGGHSEELLKLNLASKSLGLACVVFAPDNRKLAASVGDVITVWDSTSPDKKTVQLLPPRVDKTSNMCTSGIRSLLFSSDGDHIAAAHKDGKIHIWNLQHGTQLETVQMPDRNGVELVAFTIGDSNTSAINKPSTSSIGKLSSPQSTKLLALIPAKILVVRHTHFTS
ncbi:hypothetical protein VTI28DRAFT_6959 [Corynascus sepedonium]